MPHSRVVRALVSVGLALVAIFAICRGPDEFRKFNEKRVQRLFCETLLSGDRTKFDSLINGFEKHEELSQLIKIWGKPVSCGSERTMELGEKEGWIKCSPIAHFVTVGFEHPIEAGNNEADILFGYSCRSSFDFTLASGVHPKGSEWPMPSLAAEKARSTRQFPGQKPKVVSEGDRKKSRELYLAGMIAYQKDDFETAKKDWGAALVLDPQMGDSRGDFEPIKRPARPK
jgi:hypothetical protein